MNLNIVTASGWDGWAQSCLRSSKGGQVCGSCWKCFRKNTLQNVPFSMSNEIRTFLSKEPLKQRPYAVFHSTRWCFKEGVDIRQQFPQLGPHLEIDFSFLDRYLDDALQLLPRKIPRIHQSRLDTFALPMDEGEKKQLSGIDLYSGSTV